MPVNWFMWNVQFLTEAVGQSGVMKPGSSDRLPVVPRLCETIKSQIRAGSLGPGARLPSTRALAAEWGVSRTTVTAAYEQLMAEGYLETRHGARSQVAQGLGRTSTQPGQSAPPTGPDRLSAFGQRLTDFPLPPIASTEWLVADFRYGDLAAADFPMLAWRKAVTGALLRHQPRLRYGDPCGSPDLRAALQG